MNLAGLPRVHQRKGAHRVARLRQHSLSKLWALSFVVLILLPFTAPFPTYQLETSSTGHPYEATPKDVKDKAASGDDLALPSEWVLVPPTLHVVDGRYLTRPTHPEGQPTQHTVLRL